MSGHDGNRPTEGRSPTGDDRARDLSGHEKKATERGALTSWRWQRKGLIRTWKESDRARRTHFLEMAEGRTCQDTEINQPSEGYSRSGDSRGSDLSRHGKKSTKRGVLTNWRRQREGLVRTRKEIERARGTHFLEMGEGETRQDMERK